jgi:CheY-like chemotaxis protein
VTVEKPPILIVEDDPHGQDILARVLRKAGYAVIGARDGVEALRVLRGGLRPWLILLDLVMPAMDGWQFRAAQLKDDTLARIPVVLNGARSDIEVQAKHLGALGCVPYPAAVRELPQDVDRWWNLVRSAG